MQKAVLDFTLSSDWLSFPLEYMFSLDFLFLLQVQQEFGSFSNYCWSFINHKPMKNGFRYARQVPVKTQRGFRCVGPTVIYSFMQVAGLVNDHLLTCFRFQECNSNIKKDLQAKTEETEVLTNALENNCLSHD